MIKDISLVGDVIGTSVVDDETGKAMISVQRRGCHIYKPNTVSGGWYEVAFLDKPKEYNDYAITFLVEKNYADNKSFGILKIMTRITPNAGVLSLSATWEINSGLITSNYVVTHNVNSQDRVEIRLWAYENVNYQNVTFNVLSEAHGSNKTSELWELKNYGHTMSGLESIPEDYTQIPSTLAAIQNPVSLLTDFHCKRISFGENNAIKITPLSIRSTFFVLTKCNGGTLGGGLIIGFNSAGYEPEISYNSIGTYDFTDSLVYSRDGEIYIVQNEWSSAIVIGISDFALTGVKV